MRAGLRLVGQGWLMVTLQAAGIAQIAQHHVPGAILTSFAINLLWASNVRGVANRGRWGGVAYALGAALGTATGVLATWAIYGQ